VSGTMPNIPADLPRLPARARDSHKGTFGTVIVVGGSADGGEGGVMMLGAPALTGLAALRTGCGLCKLAMPGLLLPHALAVCPSATGIEIPTTETGAVEPHEVCGVIDRCADEATCLAIGPGLGTSRGSQAAVLRAVQQDHTPVVVDADGLNCLAVIPEFRQDFRAAAVLTPHPGEFKRLVEGLGMKGDLGLEKSRESAAQQLAQRLGAIVVLKGAGTVVTDGQRVWTNTIDHPCLATGGTGDVLTGIIASLIAQFVPTPQQVLFKTKVPAMPLPPGRPLDLFDAARLGVGLHGLCGVMWAEERGAEAGLIASELTELLPRAVQRVRASAN
jgi:ADP-dependent NAD(P)H-hydrate dehydratase